MNVIAFHNYSNSDIFLTYANVNKLLQNIGDTCVGESGVK